MLTCCRRTGHSHRRLSLFSEDIRCRAGDSSFAALLWGDDESCRANGRVGRVRCVSYFCVVHVAIVVLCGQAIVRLPAVTLVLPLLGGQDAAGLLHRVVVRLLDLRLHVVEVLCVSRLIMWATRVWLLQKTTEVKPFLKRWFTCGRTMVIELSAHTTSTLLLTSTLDTWPTDVWDREQIKQLVLNNYNTHIKDGGHIVLCKD